MSHFDILLPFALPPAELSADLFKQLQSPALANLLSRTRSDGGAMRLESFDQFSRALPHEIWLARAFGLDGGMQDDNSPAIAPALMRAFGIEPSPGVWFILQPVHIHIARDHLVLTDTRRLGLSDEEARPLFDIARTIFEEAGKSLIFGKADTWFLRADDWGGLQTATPDAAAGHNIDIWMPRGDGDRAWRKLQNEVQMHWFEQANSAEHASASNAHSEQAINSLWLWGGGASPAAGTATATAETSDNRTEYQQHYDNVINLSGWTAAFGRFSSACESLDDAMPAIASEPQRALVLLDTLLEPALASDWGTWLAAMQALERDWFAPLHDGLKAGTVGSVSLILSDGLRLARYTSSRASLRKFWIKPSLAPLCP